MTILIAAAIALQVTQQPARSAPTGRQATEPASASQRQYDYILDELSTIRKLLEQLVATEVRWRPKPVTIQLPPEVGQRLGRPDAPITIVEFTDLECGYCRNYFESSFKQVKKDLIETGVVQYVAMDLPLAMHRNAVAAALAVHCSAEQGRFLDMKGGLFASRDLSLKSIQRVANGLHLDTTALQECMKDRKYGDRIQRSVQIASAAAITGTPSFVIGQTIPEGVRGSLLVGAITFDTLRAKVEELRTVPRESPR